VSEILVRRFDAVPWARDVSPGNTPNEMLERAIENG
jgi:hypothetical protein